MLVATKNLGPIGSAVLTYTHCTLLNSFVNHSPLIFTNIFRCNICIWFQDLVLISNFRLLDYIHGPVEFFWLSLLFRTISSFGEAVVLNSSYPIGTNFFVYFLYLILRGFYCEMTCKQGPNLMTLYCLPPVKIVITDSNPSLIFNFESAVGISVT